MNRTPPEKVCEELRREVAFGCPICRSPLLTYHHFDPRWSEREHHDPAGMIALCAPHHSAADDGAYSTAYLRSLKKKDYKKQELRGAFPWAEKEILVRLGRSYFGRGIQIAPVHGAPILILGRDVDDGLLLMSFTLNDKEGKALATMDRNRWTCDPSLIHDLVVNTAGTNISIRHAKRKIGLQMGFERLPPANFEALLEEDSNASREKLDRQVMRWLEDRKVDSTTESVIREGIERLTPAIDALPAPWPEAYRRIPSACAQIRDWTRDNATDAEGKVTILNIANLVAWSENQEIAIRNSNLWGAPTVIETETKAGFMAVFP